MSSLFSEWDTPTPSTPIPQAPLIVVTPKPVYDNPMMGLHGKGPMHTTCQSCTHFVAVAYTRTVYKCYLRKDNTHSRETDQKAHWPTCGWYERRDGEIKLYDGRG